MLKSNKAFSLIELIVVIAVIAAIAVVIVPRVTNFSDAAQDAADQRNVQLWNSSYLTAYAADSGDSELPTTVASTTVVPNLSVTVRVGETDVTFAAAGFTLEGEGNEVAFTVGTGLTLTLN
ncbi:MAG: prepilin-type N-terminal cleavage/methylation domain-containing protein [Opitutales bacterium]|nr:prepilin-type N-terminal cleavage/methylation domain-containing protein [Opitutales bacterium]